MKRHCALLGLVFLLGGVLSTVPYATAAIVPSLLVKLTSLTGREVQNPQGDDLGNIEDVVIDAASGHVAYAVLSFGGFLGLGEKQVIMPWRSLQTIAPGDTFTLNISEEQLKNAPSFDPNEWPDMEDLHWGDTIHEYYGQEPYWGQQLPPTAAHETSQPPQFRLLRSSQVLQNDVMNTRGQHLGKIEDVVIDTGLGEIAYAVLSFGGFLGLEDKWFAVPWGAFAPAAGFGTFTLDVTKEALEKASGFDKNEWPEMADRRWGTAVHDAFGLSPYWERQEQTQAAPERRSAKAPQAQTEQAPKNARRQAVSHAPVTVINAMGTVLALIGPVTISCQPQQAVAGDVPAITQTRDKALEAKRELVVKRQSGQVEIGCEDSAKTSNQQQ
jgi:sporulation protein YlmC with PRC-barrel domain